MVRTGFVVDDHASFRRMARRLLTTAGCAVIGEAGDVASAVDLVAACRPDVVLLDVLLPDGTATDVVEQLAHRQVTTRVLLTSSYSDAELRGSLGQLPFVAKADLTVERIEAWLAEGEPGRG